MQNVAGGDVEGAASQSQNSLLLPRVIRLCLKVTCCSHCRKMFRQLGQCYRISRVPQPKEREQSADSSTHAKENKALRCRGELTMSLFVSCIN